MRGIIFAVSCFVTVDVVAGPFGLDKGMSLDALKRSGNFTAENTSGIYTSKTLANGHADFESFTVIVTPEHGLCKILATGKNIDSSAYGSEVQDKFNELSKALSEKYGSPGSKYDFLRSGSIWNEPRDWMMGLSKKERTLASFWTPPQNSNLPDSLLSIKIEALALSNKTGYVNINYEFDNVNECLASLKSRKNSNL